MHLPTSTLDYDPADLNRLLFMTLNNSPYSKLPDAAFWSTSVAQKNALQISGLWTPKFKIEKSHTIATAGSCFAQHIGKAMQMRGYNWFDSEPAPHALDERVRRDFNYGVFSFRTGNIYTVALLRQWLEWALGSQKPEDIEVCKTEGGRFIDPFRPNIVPGGFANKAELIAARETTFRAIKETFECVDIFIFTLGLTEAWINTASNCVYPMCPGTLAGEYNPEKHRFINYQYPEIRKALRKTMKLAKELNPSIRFLLTVSPVPLTATASGEHVLTATIHSKSVLRAVAGDIAHTRTDTDYFPSYEIISSFPFRGMFYQANQRSVAPEGVDFVMNAFFDCQKRAFGAENSAPPILPDLTSTPSSDLDQLDEEICEDALLDAFNSEKQSEISKDSTHKICLIGSSHLGVVRQAWAREFKSNHPNLHATFFGAPGTGLCKVFVSENRVKSNDEKVQKSFFSTSGNSAEINLLEFDSFILHGLNFPLKSIKAFLETLPLARADQKNVVSKENLKKFINEAINTNPVIILALAIREASKGPIYISAAPLWSVLERDAAEDKYMIVRKTGSLIKEIYWNAINELLIKNDIILIAQPEETIEDIYFTKEIYTMGYDGDNIRDFGHMNIKYGSIVIKRILSYINGLT